MINPDEQHDKQPDASVLVKAAAEGGENPTLTEHVLNEANLKPEDGKGKGKEVKPPAGQPAVAAPKSVAGNQLLICF